MRSLIRTIGQRSRRTDEIVQHLKTLLGRSRSPKAVFIHSSFRTSSTWLWQAFRNDPRAYAYCEVFHEELSFMRIDEIEQHRYDSWPSNHPPGAPYFLEYAALMKPEGGVLHHRREFALGQFIPAKGLLGPLSPETFPYISGLIDYAVREQRVPVLTCCRSLGRIRSLKREFGGWHIFLCRNLVQQWMSYFAQHQRGNDYFINSVAEILRLNMHDAFLAELAERYLKSPCVSKTPVGDFADLDAAFSAFAGLHIYLSMFAADNADQIIDANALARDRCHVKKLAADIFSQTGLSVALGDARESVDIHGSAHQLPDNFDDILNELYRRCRQSLSSVVGRRARAFGKKYVNDAIAEGYAFKRFSVGFQRSIEQNLAAMRALIDKLNISESARKEAEQCGARTSGEVVQHLKIAK